MFLHLTKTRWIFTLMVASIYCVSYGQDMIAKNITTHDGLPSSEAYAVVQDENGFIWVGTDHGLARYDGTGFTVYTTEDGLPDNTVLRLNPGENGRIWITTLSNDLVYLEDGEIHPYQFKYSKKGFPIDLKSPIYLGTDSTGKKWIRGMMTSHILLQEIEGDSFRINLNDFNEFSERFNKQLPKSTRWDVVELKDNKVGSCMLFDSIPIPQQKVLVKPNYLRLYGAYYGDEPIRHHRRFFKLNKHEIVGVNDSGEYVAFDRFGVKDVGVFGVREMDAHYRDKRNVNWLVSPHGAHSIHRDSNGLYAEHVIRNRFVTRLIEDYEGSFWFSDHNKGLGYVANPDFRQLRLDQGCGQPRVTSFKVRNGQLWFSTISGEIWKVSEDLKPEMVYLDSRRSNDFYPFEVLPNNELVLPGPLKVDYKTGRKRKFGFTNYVFKTLKCVLIYGDTVVYGSSEGLIRFSLSTLGLTYSTTDYLVGSRFSDGQFNSFNLRINALQRDKDRVWIGTTKGLYFERRDTIHSYKHDLLAHRIMAFGNIDSSLLAIGTKGGGLLILNKETGEVVTIQQQDGLPSNQVRCIYVDGAKVYVGTNSGFCVFSLSDDLKPLNLITFNTQNALSSNEINDMVVYGNRLWIATNNGIIYVDPNRLKSNENSPYVHVVGIEVNDSQLNVDSSIVMDVKQRNVTFRFNGLAYRMAGEVQFKYILEGFDQDTTFTTTNQARYTNVSPGEHTFHVWARNEDGVWSSKPASVSVSVPHKFTETLWFVFLMVVLAAAAITFTIILLFKRKRKKLREDLQNSKLKQQALAALMNPHFVYNSLSAIQHLINTDNVGKSNKYLSQFSRLVRQNLVSVKNGFIQMEDELERLKLYMDIERMRFGDKLSYEILFKDDFDDVSFSIPSMILQPFVENAIWHGILPQEKPGYIRLSFEVIEEADILAVTITDNGIGIDHARKTKKKHHTSVSLEITKERLDLLGKQNGKYYRVDIEQRNGEEGGTSVYIEIPIIW
ncbi:MAG: histidine kinase [Bacteroidia bacterium]|nr:histidine kinase [Bacteroidia bacterium]